MRATVLLLLFRSVLPAAGPTEIRLWPNGAPGSVHIYATGGHGFGINPNTRNPSPAATTWQLRLGDWLKQIGMLP